MPDHGQRANIPSRGWMVPTRVPEHKHHELQQEGPGALGRLAKIGGSPVQSHSALLNSDKSFKPSALMFTVIWAH